MRKKKTDGEIVGQTVNDFDEINLKIQNAINELLKKDNNNICVEFLNDDTTVKEFIDSGFLSLNYIMSGRLDGGYPVGRITEISGDPSSGKTLLSTIAAISSLKSGRIVYYLDSEQAYDVSFAKLVARTMGQDPDIVKKINYIQIDKVEEFTQVTTKIVDAFEKNKINVGATIILDSIAFLSTEKEYNDVMDGENKVDMTKAKELRKFFRVLKNKISHLNIAMICTNQLTYNIGVMYGDNKTTTGGTAVPFAASVRLRLNAKKLSDGNDAKKIVGLSIRAKTTKSRLTVPYKETEIDIFFNGKFSNRSGLFDTLYSQGIIKQSGARTYKSCDVEFTKADFERVMIDDESNFAILKNAVENELLSSFESQSSIDENGVNKIDLEESDI